MALRSGRFSNHPSTAVGASDSILAWPHWLGGKAGTPVAFLSLRLSHFLSSALTFEPSFSLPCRSDSLLVWGDTEDQGWMIKIPWIAQPEGEDVALAPRFKAPARNLEQWPQLGLFGEAE